MPPVRPTSHGRGYWRHRPARRGHHRTSRAFLAKWKTVPLLETSRQMCVRQQKKGDWQACLWWAERGLARYGQRAARQEAVEDLERRRNRAAAKLAAPAKPPKQVAKETFPPPAGVTASDLPAPIPVAPTSRSCLANGACRPSIESEPAAASRSGALTATDAPRPARRRDLRAHAECTVRRAATLWGNAPQVSGTGGVAMAGPRRRSTSERSSYRRSRLLPTCPRRELVSTCRRSVMAPLSPEKWLQEDLGVRSPR